MSTQEQTSFLAANCFRASILQCLTLEGCNTGMDQLINSFSELDLANFRMEFGHCLPASCLLRLTATDLGMGANQQLLSEYLTLASYLADLIHPSSRTFQLTVLLAIFHGSTTLKNSRSRYLR